MPLFQNNIINKYLQAQNQTLVAQQWAVYQKHFHNPHVQDNIRGSKEEQYQEGFLTDLFVNILGYTQKPAPNYNLTTELKNVKDSKKADGAIIIDQNVRAVIELKGTNTTDLNKIEAQAFGYKNNQANCTYVITANFEKLRLYIDNAIEHIEFNLFSLTQKEFQLLYLCLAYNNIAQNIPQRIKAESQQAEDQITQQLYRDYSAFKHQLFDNLRLRNPQHDQLVLFKKSQKLLDKFLFLFFAEDRQLLQANSVRSILQQWKASKDWDDYRPLYNHYKKYFYFLINGIKNETLEVFPYNGGLFEADDILDNLLIDDHILYDHTQKLSAYDFGSEVDVNILGHIFENSLNEIDEMTAQLQGQNIDKTQTKRKKDGIFYTPRYITKYIVENTVGKLCTDKKNDLQIIDTDYVADKKRTVKEKKPLLERLDAYRQWLLQITICDPACGSGAFLNEALNFLIHEHRYIDELQAKVFGDAFVLTDVELSILENNLFGVDINDESVEIARLALWLRTARPKRKLNTLSNNIKCGNSLISNPNIAGDKAFDWQTAFPKVFERGGFDVVIGNPPYGAKLPKEQTEYLVTKYSNLGISKVFSDSYFIFTVLGVHNLLRDGGVLSYIMPNSWRLIEAGTMFRKTLFSNYSFLKIIQHAEKVFSDATVDCDTIVVKKSLPTTNKVQLIKQKAAEILLSFDVEQKILLDNDFINLEISPQERLIADKVFKTSLLVKDILSVKNGVKPYEKGKGTPPQTDEIMRTKPFTSEIKVNDTFVPLIGGSSFQKYNLLWDSNEYISYGSWLAAPRDSSIFFDKEEKLIFRQTSDKLIGTLIGKGFVMRNNTHILLKINNDFNLKFVLSLLNSKLLNFIYWTINPEKGEALAEVKAFHLGMLPIKKIPLDAQQPFIAHADSMLELHAALSSLTQKVQRSLQREFSLASLNTKLQQWHSLSYANFLGELAKQKVKLTLPQKSEWEEFFVTEQQKAHSLQQQIEQTDRQINAMVYALYGLSDEEIAVVESN